MPCGRCTTTGTPPLPRSTRDHSILTAILLVCAGGFLFVTMNSIVKSLTERFDTVMLVWARYFFHVIIVAAMFPRRLPLLARRQQLPLHLGRSLLLLLATIFNFAALVFLPLGEVAAITFTSPILVAALAVLLLRERVAIERWLVIGLGFAGALLIVQPGNARVEPGAILALSCAGCYAFYQISTRIVRESDAVISLLYGGLVGMVTLSAAVPFFWQPPSALEWLLLALIGGLGGIGHLFVIMALQKAEASRVSPFIYVQLVWAMLSSLIVFGDAPEPMTLLGACIIVVSGLALYRLDMRERAAAALRRSDQS